MGQNDKLASKAAEVFTGPGCRFEYTETEPDGGGSLRVFAETEERAEELCDIRRGRLHFREKAKVLSGPLPYVETCAPRVTTHSGREAWYAYPVCVDDEWTLPYVRRLESIVGTLKESPLSFPIIDPRPLCHTYFRGDLRFEEGHIQAVVAVSAHAWNGRTALEYGHERAEKYLLEELAERPPMREFIENRNGTYSKNPRYGTGAENPLRAQIPQYPRGLAVAFWEGLWTWWLTTQATPGQKDAYAARLNGRDRFHNSDAPRLGGYDGGLYIPDPAGGCDWSAGQKARFLKWEDFQKLT